ncbi:MAG: tRNA uridine-5-carboxymethylaminomethyl(34) synthesis GTPase MnmE [Acidobacteria bacterium]|nr:tRNA uridine-5-carboxymethylaminomethyl(34) synthesis GTPase MnmE [Acidobacteriota bacterium]
MAAPDPTSGACEGLADHVIVTFFPGPHSYSGEDVVEISAHGSPVVLHAIVRAALCAGARLAEPGEFSLRAFLHGKLDLVQAEAVADLIDAVTPLQARTAFDQLDGTLTARIAALEANLFDLMAKLEASLDFPEEGYHFIEPGQVATEIDRLRSQVQALLGDARRGRLVREGAQVAIVGAPNVGKSSLFNALLDANRAIVSTVAGTTRDLLTERLDLGGLSIALVDTAGVHETDDPVEREGVARARLAAASADVIVAMLDRSRPLSDADRDVLASTKSRPRLIVANKVDQAPAWSVESLDEPHTIAVSVRERIGFEAVTLAIQRALIGGESTRDTPAISNIRHVALLDRVGRVLGRSHDAVTAANESLSEEFVLSDLQEASALLQEVSGRRTADDLLQQIFARFCIGK